MPGNCCWQHPSFSTFNETHMYRNTPRIFFPDYTKWSEMYPNGFKWKMLLSSELNTKGQGYSNQTYEHII